MGGAYCCPQPLHQASWAWKETPHGTRGMPPGFEPGTMGFAAANASNHVPQGTGIGLMAGQELLKATQRNPPKDRAMQRMQAVYERQLDRLKSLEESILDQMAAQQQSVTAQRTGGMKAPFRGQQASPERAEFRVY